MKVTQEMLQRFLTWPVPAECYPDGTPGKPGRTGTNLLTAALAQAMLEHVLATKNHGTEGIVGPAEGRELTYGEKAVGLGFNPGANPEVHACKAGFAVEIDRMHNLRNKSDDADVWRMTAIAIEGLQTAQMWAVKAVTWKS
jgi:hypothetical protein